LAPPRISSTFTFFIELLAAVPSVIYGLLAIFTLVPLMRDYVEPFLKKTLGFLPIFSGPIFGFGYLTAGVILAIMTLPFIISISREALLEVPTEQREAALALGATRWESTWQAVVPYARLGIFRLDFSRSGARPGRNHGGHHGDRKRSQHSRLPVCARVYHSRSDRQRVLGGHRRPVPAVAGGTRPGAVPAHYRDQRHGALCSSSPPRAAGAPSHDAAQPLEKDAELRHAEPDRRVRGSGGHPCCF
jgi:hypothetical protein